MRKFLLVAFLVVGVFGCDPSNEEFEARVLVSRTNAVNWIKENADDSMTLVSCNRSSRHSALCLVSRYNTHENTYLWCSYEELRPCALAFPGY